MGEELRAKSDREAQRYVSVDRAAKMLGLCTKTVRAWIASGKLAAIKGDTAGGKWLVDVTSIERLAAAR